MQVPPVQPVITTVWTIEEVNQLPEGYVVIWSENDGHWQERRAAVIHDDNGRKSIEHTRSTIYYVSDRELIEYPALALKWPAGGSFALEPSEHDSPE